MPVTDTRRAGAREWLGLGVLALPTALIGLDVTLLYLALPSLSLDLRPTGTQALWILDAYGLLIAGLLITMGTLGDRIGRRRLLLIGTAAFGAVSVVAAYATSAEMLIAARAVLGVAGATLMPSTLALISNMFLDARQRAMAIGVWATTFALGMAAGPLVGGLLLERFWWGSAFLIALPVVVVVLVAAPLLLPEYRAPEAGRLDPVSVAMSLAAILPFVYAIKHAGTEGVDVLAVAAVTVAVAFGVGFVRRQRRLSEPLLDMSLFTDRAFSAALTVLLVVLVGVGGALFLVTQHLQLVEELSPLAAGAWMGPPALAMFVAALGAPLAARRVRPGYVVAAALALSVLGYLALTQVHGAGSLAAAVTGFALVYVGFGAVGALGTDLVVGAAPTEKAGSAAAMSETVQELGAALGVAVLGSLAAGIYRDRIGVALPGAPSEVATPVGEGLAGAVAVPALPADLLERAKEAFTAGLNVTAGVAGVAVFLLAAVSAAVLRHVPATAATPVDEGADAG